MTEATQPQPPSVPSTTVAPPLPRGSVVEEVYLNNQQPAPPKQKSLTKLPMPPNTQVPPTTTIINDTLLRGIYPYYVAQYFFVSSPTLMVRA